MSTYTANSGGIGAAAEAMTLLLGLLAAVLSAIVTTVTLRRRRPSVDRFKPSVLQRVVERHEKENQNLGRG